MSNRKYLLDLDNEKLELIEYVGFGTRCKGYAIPLAIGLRNIVSYLLEKRKKDIDNEVYNIMLDECYFKQYGNL